MPTAAAESFNLAWHCLGRQAAERGGKTALIIADGPDAFRSWTYAELDGMVRRLAGGLVASGLGEGDRVLIRAANDIDFVLAFFAAAAIGCVAQPASRNNPPMATVEDERAANWPDTFRLGFDPERGMRKSGHRFFAINPRCQRIWIGDPPTALRGRPGAR